MSREPSLLGARFGRSLFHSRRFAGLSQQELADLVGMHRVNLGELERGLRLPRADTIVKLAAGMEISTCVLLEGMEWHPGPQAHGGDFYLEHPASPLRRSVRR